MQSDGARPSPVRIKEIKASFCSEEIALHHDLTLRISGLGLRGIRPTKDVTKDKNQNVPSALGQSLSAGMSRRSGARERGSERHTV